MTKALALLVPLALLGAVPTAHAATVEVSHRDLDLRTAEGQRILALRVEDAIRKVCELPPRMTERRLDDPEAKSCYALARYKSGIQLRAAIARAAGER